ncbi:hypothetical protein MHYP_G00317950 [Metynnis hypsauchen]
MLEVEGALLCSGHAVVGRRKLDSSRGDETGQARRRRFHSHLVSFPLISPDRVKGSCGGADWTPFSCRGRKPVISLTPAVRADEVAVLSTGPNCAGPLQLPEWAMFGSSPSFALLHPTSAFQALHCLCCFPEHGKISHVPCHSKAHV